ncbi:MAG: hypothetical protein HY608_06140 [Planctomycetes bacterium]|nr:hypothetical protein [Planctomycetota bacterium]
MSASCAVAATMLLWGVYGTLLAHDAATDALAGREPSWFHRPSMQGALVACSWPEFAGAGWIFALTVGQAAGFALAIGFLVMERVPFLARHDASCVNLAGLALAAFLVSGAGWMFPRSSLFSIPTIVSSLAIPWGAYLAYNVPRRICGRPGHGWPGRAARRLAAERSGLRKTRRQDAGAFYASDEGEGE